MDRVATPPPIVPVPRLVAPSKNPTLPEAAGGVTVAVKVTVWPTTDGLTSLTTAVVVAVLSTIWVVEAVLGRKTVSPT